MSKLMKKKGLIKFLVVVLILVAVVVFFQIKGTSTSDNSDKYKDVDLTANSDSYGREDTYAKYVTQHEDTRPEGEENTYELNVLKPTNSQGTSIRTDVGPSDDKSTALQIPEKVMQNLK